MYPFYCPFTMFKHTNSDVNFPFRTNSLYTMGTSNYMRFSTLENHIVVKSKEINHKKKYIEETIKIPVLNGIKNENMQKYINTSIESDIMEFANQMDQAANEYGLEYEKQGKKPIPYVAATNYVITYNKNNILSISILYYQYINGKRSYIKTSYNFDLTTGKPLGLGDLFKPGVAYTHLINEEIKKQLSMNKNLYMPNAAANFEGIQQGQPFYLEDGNIVLYFGFNEIAPTVSEIPIIKIPFSSFKNNIKDIFLK